MKSKGKFYDPFKMIDNIVLDDNLKVCPNCKARNEEKAGFCFVCGFKFANYTKNNVVRTEKTITQNENKRNINSSDRSEKTISFEFENGQLFKTSSFPVFIGKDKNVCNLHIESNVVSRKHATIFFTNNNFYIVDNASTNGTFLNGARLDQKKKYVLNQNDIIRLAKTNLKIKIG